MTDQNSRGSNSGKHSPRNGATRHGGNDAGASGAARSPLAVLSYLAGLRTQERNHKRAEAMGNAQLAEAFNHFTPPDDDDVIHYQDNSPTTTTHHHYQPPPSKAGGGWLVAAALALAGGGGLSGYAAHALLTRQVAPPAATDTDTQNTLRFLE